MEPPRRLGPADVPACLALGAQYIWGPETRKWDLLLALGEAWGLDDPAGGLAAMGVVTRFDPCYAWIGMLVVGKPHAGRGLGKRLMAHLLARGSPLPAMLYATEAGRPLYDRLGFRVADTLTMFTGRGLPGPEPPGLRAMTAADLPAVAAFDAAAAGVDRSRLLAALLPVARGARVLARDGRIAGYGLVWENHDKAMLGPLAAEDDAGALALVEGLAGPCGLPLRLDLHARHRHLADRVRGFAIEAARDCPLMVLGPADPPGERARLYAPAMQALG